MTGARSVVETAMSFSVAVTSTTDSWGAIRASWRRVHRVRRGDAGWPSWMSIRAWGAHRAPVEGPAPKNIAAADLRALRGRGDRASAGWESGSRPPGNPGEDDRSTRRSPISSVNFMRDADAGGPRCGCGATRRRGAACTWSTQGHGDLSSFCPRRAARLGAPEREHTRGTGAWRQDERGGGRAVRGAARPLRVDTANRLRRVVGAVHLRSGRPVLLASSRQSSATKCERTLQGLDEPPAVHLSATAGPCASRPDADEVTRPRPLPTMVALPLSYRRCEATYGLVGGADSNLRRLIQRLYSPSPYHS